MECWRFWSIKKLEDELSPSRWNPNKLSNDVIKEYVNTGINETSLARKAFDHSLDIPYRSLYSEHSKMDVYGTKLPNNSPIFVWIHGGYWQEGSKEIAGGVALNVCALRIKTIVLGYTLAPNAKVGDIKYELMDALKHIIETYPNSKIIVGGHSAGAHFVAELLYSSDELLFPEIYQQLLGLVFVSGIYDLRPLVHTYINDALNMTMNDAESLSPLIKTTININFKTTNIRALVMYGSYDSTEFQRQSLTYGINLERQNIECTLHEIPTDDHFTIVEHLSRNDTGTSGHILKSFLSSLVQ